MRLKIFQKKKIMVKTNSLCEEKLSDWHLFLTFPYFQHWSCQANYWSQSLMMVLLILLSLVHGNPLTVRVRMGHVVCLGTCTLVLHKQNVWYVRQLFLINRFFPWRITALEILFSSYINVSDVKYHFSIFLLDLSKYFVVLEIQEIHPVVSFSNSNSVNLNCVTTH